MADKPSYEVKTDNELNTILPFMRPQVRKVLEEMKALGHQMMVTDGNRTWAEQTALYSKGRRGIKGEKTVTNARAGYSYHNYGVAVDMTFVVDGQPNWSEGHPWAKYGEVAKKHGFSWGGDWWKFGSANDKPHIEMSFGYSTAKLLKMGEANAKDLLQRLGVEKFPQEPVIPTWAKESVEKAITLGIKDWSNPNQPVDRALVAYLLNDLGIITQIQKDENGIPFITKAQFVHGMNKKGLLKKFL